MDSKRIAVLKTSFDDLSYVIAEEHIEYWLARDLMPYLGYTRWENFVEAIHRAETSCLIQKNKVFDHFRDVTKMIDLPKGAKREIADVMLSRYACYLIAMNGDPRKEEIAFAQGSMIKHMTNNTTVRTMLGQRGILPENLPPAPDIKKLERHIKSAMPQTHNNSSPKQ